MGFLYETDHWFVRATDEGGMYTVECDDHAATYLLAATFHKARQLADFLEKNALVFAGGAT